MGGQKEGNGGIHMGFCALGQLSFHSTSVNWFHHTAKNIDCGSPGAGRMLIVEGEEKKKVTVTINVTLSKLKAVRPWGMCCSGQLAVNSSRGRRTKL